MTHQTQKEERLVRRKVRYTLEVNGQLVVVENVPARVDVETGEQFFSPQTVEQLQQIVRGEQKPVRVMEVPVFDYPGHREFIEAINRAYEEPDPEEEKQQALMRDLHRRAIEVEDDW